MNKLCMCLVLFYSWTCHALCLSHWMVLRNCCTCVAFHRESRLINVKGKWSITQQPISIQPSKRKIPEITQSETDN